MREIDSKAAYNTSSPTTTQPLNFSADFLPSSSTQTFVTVAAVPERSAAVTLAIAVLTNSAGGPGRQASKIASHVPEALSAGH